MQSRKSEADLYQQLSASGYADQIQELRNDNLLLRSENERLNSSVGCLEVKIHGLRLELNELKQTCRGYKAQSAMVDKTFQAREVQHCLRYDQLRKENAHLRNLLHHMNIVYDGSIEITETPHNWPSSVLPSLTQLDSPSSREGDNIMSGADVLSASTLVLLSPKVILGGLSSDIT